MNGPAGRGITGRLHGGGSAHQPLREMRPGIGGVRSVRAYRRLTGHPAPEVCRTGEGRAGFLGRERIRERIRRPRHRLPLMDRRGYGRSSFGPRIAP
ncbi:MULTISPECIES: hypothetical protein [Streptomyces]|uniref:hypothetical protein n=1 Tax=Streptomyces TaxID=1883 RepID=UPI00069A5C12|nr:hypothetical protein [Streptomyces sp. SID7805]